MDLVLSKATPVASLWQRVDARCELAAAVIVGLTPFFLRTLPGAAVGLVMAWVLLASARPNWSDLGGRMATIGVFLFIVVAFMPWTMGEPYWALGPIRLSEPGLRTGLMIVLRAVTMLTIISWLLATHPLQVLLRAAQNLGVPRFITSLLLLTHRYVYLFGEQLHQLRITLRTRGYRNRVSRVAYRTIGHVTGALLVRSFERAERVNHAMRCRGFVGDFHLLRGWQLGWSDAILCFLLIVTNCGMPLAVDLWARS